MRKTYLATLLAAFLLSACGGGGSSTPEAPPAGVQPTQPTEPVKPRFARQISFGDSLSDVGTYAVGKVKELNGGKYTINGDNTRLNPALTGQIWVEQLAQQLSLAAPCAAQTGLDGIAALGFSVPVVNHTGCFAYAQGGARVTDPVGPSHKLTGDALGGLTVPVATQISRHLALSGGKFQPDDLVLVMAGGNDLFFNVAVFQSAAQAAARAAYLEDYAVVVSNRLARDATDPVAGAAAINAAVAAERARQGSTEESVDAVAIMTAAGLPGNAAFANSKVQTEILLFNKNLALRVGESAAMNYMTDNLESLVDEMIDAGKELAAMVKDRILANGAQYVVVNNLPDPALAPTGRATDETMQKRLSLLTLAFNVQLSNALSNNDRVLLVDTNALIKEAVAKPTAFGLTNVTDTACDVSKEKNATGDALVCNASNLKEGDVSRYAYADGNHPTPLFHGVLTTRVARDMKTKGWQ